MIRHMPSFCHVEVFLLTIQKDLCPLSLSDFLHIVLGDHFGFEGWQVELVPYHAVIQVLFGFHYGLGLFYDHALAVHVVFCGYYYYILSLLMF